MLFIQTVYSKLSNFSSQIRFQLLYEMQLLKKTATKKRRSQALGQLLFLIKTTSKRSIFTHTHEEESQQEACTDDKNSFNKRFFFSIDMTKNSF